MDSVSGDLGKGAGELPRAPWRSLESLAWPAALVGLAAWGLVLAAHGRGGDFAIYVRAAGRFLRAEPIYQLGDEAWVFKYAPPSAAMFVPFTLLPLKVATALWNLALVASLAFLRPLLASLYEPSAAQRRDPLSGAVLAGAMVAVGQSLFLELFYGQVDLPMLLLLALSAHCAERGRRAAAGGCWALAVALKPTAALFGLYLLARRPRAIGWGIGAGLALWMPVLLRYGVAGATDLASAWAATVSRTTTPWMLGANSQGLPALLLQAFGGEPVTLSAATAAQLGALAVSAAVLWPARRSRAHFFAGLCFAVAFTSALAWRANFALALPMVALALTVRSPFRAVPWALVALDTGVQLVFADGLLGRERLQAALLARPFALAFGAMWAWTLASARASDGKP
jgi:hypothetical protein